MRVILVQHLASAADAALQLGSLVQDSCYSHARALLALLSQQAHTPPCSLPVVVVTCDV